MLETGTAKSRFENKKETLTERDSDRLTLPSCRSEMEQASMKAWAMTDRHASM